MDEREMKSRIEAELAKQPGRILNANGAPSTDGQAVLRSIYDLVKKDLQEVAAGRGNDVPN